METGTVVDVTPDTAKVEIVPGVSCDSCACSSRCSGTAGRPFVVEAENVCGASSGDEVTVDMAPVPPMLSILFVFVMPLVLFLTGLGLGRAASGADWGAMVGAVIGLLVGFALLKVINRAVESKGEYRPTVVRIIRAQH